MEKIVMGSVPIPDPTVLSTDLVNREIKNLREIIGARLDGYDTAIEILQESLSRRQEIINASISHLQALQGEKFDGVQKQFMERDTRTEKTAELNQKAIDAALQAAKEAVSAQQTSNSIAITKSETSTLKQIEQLSELLRASLRGTDEKINDLKERLTRIEGSKSGGFQVWSAVAIMIGLLISATGIIVGIVIHK